jgi:transcriptional regulator
MRFERRKIVEHDNLKKQFLELRAQGMSFNEIATELNTTVEKLKALAKRLQESVKKGGCRC